MNCDQTQSLLLAYLDGEITRSERALILAHLSGCTVCQQELDLLSTARGQVRSALQRRVIQAVPSREAWNRLEARLPRVQENSLPEVAQPSSKVTAWFSRKAPSAGHAFNQLFGGVKMQKRWVFSGLALVLVLSIVAVIVANNVTTVSAKEVLDRAYQVQTQTVAKQGIEHIRSEIYTDIEAKEQGMNTIVESYSDPVNGNFRVVTTDKETGKVLQVNAFDGSDVYTSDNMQDGQPREDPLTVYHNVQDPNSLMKQKTISVMNRKLSPAQDDESKFMFEKMRSDPQVELVGQETWNNVSTVYVLRSQQEIKLLVNNEITHPMGLVTFYFNADTYQLLGSRVTMQKDGKEVLISSQRTLLDEILPAGSNIAWDLSDLRGINIVEDPNGEHSLPMKNPSTAISTEELASKTDSAYLLKTVPDGFSLEVGVLPEQPVSEQFFYEAVYTNQAGDDFIVRTLGKPLEEADWRGETYTTANGLTLHFVDQTDAGAKRGEFTRVLIEAPNGTTYMIESTLSSDQVKALTEELTLVK